MPLLREGAEQYCRWLTGVSQSHFAVGLRLLPRRKRQAMEAVYAFCRAVDDVVDREETEDRRQRTEDRGEERAQRELELWKQELRACAQGFPTHPIAVALQPVVSEYQIPLQYFEALIRGVEMDMTKKRYRTFEELTVYCHHVASVVGLISIRIFGCRHPATVEYAQSLGMALQLTNILRDLKTDWERGRVYLPFEELRRFGYSEYDLATSRTSESFFKLMRFQTERARGFFEAARRALRESREYRRLLPARIMGRVYEALLGEIEKEGFNVFARRVSVPPLRQFRIALSCLVSLL